ncbi:MAG TPA: FAD-dependent oxidoreductase [Gemmatimonadales bacterium]|nr:FAD-dependent oxidoreductase [Gemmatimonadales bacterium]
MLAGGGHAHLFVLEGLLRGRRPTGLDVTLVAQDRQHAYSGMVPGLIGGRYRVDELLLDLAALARVANADFIEGTASAIEPASRSLVLADGRRVPYDLLSIAVGSATAGADLPGVRDHALPVKPIDRMLAIVPALEQALAGGGPGGPDVAVVGGGAGGVELALNLRARLRLLGRPDAAVSVVEESERILGDRSASCRRAAEAALAGARIGLVLGGGVAAVERDRLLLRSGATVPARFVVWATGAVGAPLLAGSGLALDGRGFLRVDRTLRSVSHAEIFGAGDSVTPEHRPDLPKSGVYAVRQGPVLRDNLLAAAAGRRPRRRFRPPRRSLALLNTGDDRAILCYGDLTLTGRWAMALKDRIDRRFVERFRR